MTVYLLLEEGPQTQIRGLDFTGNKFFSNFELTQVTKLETNTPLRLNGFETSLENLKAFYRNQGFLEMKLLNESEDVIQYNDKGTQARILFQIYEGPRIRVNAITVEGNVQTKTRVILKEADFNLGEVLTPQKLDDATVRLNKMGLFTRADIHTLEEGTNVSDRTLVISVTERDPGAVRFGGGVTSERNLTVRGFTGAELQQFMGHRPRHQRARGSARKRDPGPISGKRNHRRVFGAFFVQHPHPRAREFDPLGVRGGLRAGFSEFYADHDQKPD